MQQAKLGVLVPTLRGPLFDFGRLARRVESAKAQREQAEIGYQQAILAAVRDVRVTPLHCCILQKSVVLPCKHNMMQSPIPIA